MLRFKHGRTHRDSIVAIYAGYSFPWKLLGSWSSIVAFILFYSVFLSFCSLLIVYWVAEDGHKIEELRELILEMTVRLHNV